MFQTKYLSVSKGRFLQKAHLFYMALLIVVSTSIHPLVLAATQNASANAQISFTFDDGLASASNLAAPTLAKYGLKGTNYVVTGCIDMTTIPNTCHADVDKSYMTWNQVASLQNTYGWEIGSHTVTHPYLASKDASDGQPNLLTIDQIRRELRDSKSALTSRGFAAESFSTPYGDYNPAVMSEIAKVYSNHRGFADIGQNQWPYNEYLIYTYQVQHGVSVAQVKAQIDQAIASKKWLVLTFHDIVPTIQAQPGSTDQIYDYQNSMLEEIAAYVQAKKTANLIADRTVSQSKVTGTNLLPGGDFMGGLTNGWRTDSPATVLADSTTNGSFPTATNSIRFSTPAIGRHSHLFSPTVTVTPSVKYLFRNFVNVGATVGGGIGYYVDEYDASGNWISGQYLGEETSIFTENFSRIYTPSSQNVAKMSAQVIGFGSTLSAYVDNIELIALTDSQIPTPVNLMSNGSFEQGFTGWRTDNAAQIVHDSTTHGSPASPTSSVRFTAGASNAHLFSPRVSVTSNASYSVSMWLNLTTLSSRSVGYYVDEYDATGNWVSGQYKADVTTIGVRDVSFTYTPSSAQVTSASLQVIVVGGSGATGYVDDIRWFKN